MSRFRDAVMSALRETRSRNSPASQANAVGCAPVSDELAGELTNQMERLRWRERSLGLLNHLAAPARRGGSMGAAPLDREMPRYPRDALEMRGRADWRRHSKCMRFPPPLTGAAPVSDPHISSMRMPWMSSIGWTRSPLATAGSSNT